MKKALIVLLACIVTFAACRKGTDNPAGNTSSTRLKSITHPTDTTQPLCVGCPPVYTQVKEYFFYDNSDKLTSRIAVTSSQVNNVITLDSVVYAYLYTVSLISGYSETKASLAIYHALLYDSQNRIILDSVTNPQSNNNRVSSFRYFPDTVIQTTRFNASTGFTTIIDTMAYAGINIKSQRIKTLFPNGSSSFRELAYTSFVYQNPLAYVNNFGLFASEYRNAGAQAISFSIFTPQNIVHDLASQVVVKYGSTQYISLFLVVLDTDGRIQKVTDIANGSRQTIYEYY